MNSVLNRAYVLILFIFTACHNSDQIIKLLNSNNKDDIIRGAFEAGETKNRVFVPYILNNASDVRMSTNIRFYGVTVYQAKMQALEKIFEKSPPHKITYKLDSSVIKYYVDLSKENDESK